MLRLKKIVQKGSSEARRIRHIDEATGKLVGALRELVFTSGRGPWKPGRRHECVRLDVDSLASSTKNASGMRDPVICSVIILRPLTACR